VKLTSQNGTAVPTSMTVWVSAKSLGIIVAGKVRKH
jgi:hypothetical protein